LIAPTKLLSAPAVAPAELQAVGSAPACWTQPYSARVDLIALAELLLAPADYLGPVCQSAHRYFLDAQPVCWLVAELQRDSPERYTVFPLASRV
jgi:hypothetical protein